MALMAGRQNDSSGQEQKQGRRRNIKEICNRKRRDWEGYGGTSRHINREINSKNEIDKDTKKGIRGEFEKVK